MILLDIRGIEGTASQGNSQYEIHTAHFLGYKPIELISLPKPEQRMGHACAR